MPKRVVVVLDDEIHSMFRAACKDRRVSQQTVIEDCVKDFIASTPPTDIPPDTYKPEHLATEKKETIDDDGFDDILNKLL